MIAVDVASVLLVVLAFVVVGVAAIAARRRALARPGGTVELSLRLDRGGRGGGWVLGVGRFEGDALHWYRVFSLAMRPRRTLTRRDLTVLSRREPTAGEHHGLVGSAIVMECATSAGPVDLAMGRSALTGFLAWLEATPPGATLHH
jgi:hypothetical protein